MHIFYGKAPLIAHLNSSQFIDSTIGFVPTMGALHDGHLALMERSLRENEYTVVSIFVNPTQFNNPEDLAKYPRTLEEDVRKITALNPEVIIYAPSVDDIYDGKPVSQSFDFDGLENQMEGKFRPGHFDGVGTIVKRLFEIVTPTQAYFGEKDFQQLQIVKKLVAKNQLPVTIVGCPIYREANQLAMSSRNERLSSNERNQASIIYQTLVHAKILFQNETIASAIQLVQQTFENHPLFDLEYFVIADEETLLSSNTKEENKKYRAFIAVFVNNIRLIDTISLN
ncbi:pantoate--beta-alanine ligase [Flavobacterium sp.]|uniref:pantoate--beta-alanine ligase n=1 Tax=Flavobacterium sp. TaxID=239 RepID=UPI0008CA8C10|nr:pantoate--beta-alanine ligase [Flavobacterium sp.]OGS64542.1 MAG: pantoate--beta-alanine ligase [Flavobacteria bacterium GWA2_35_26]HCF04543.1 pantoate--beta-alanine ligase [Flavobacterium sp.]